MTDVGKYLLCRVTATNPTGSAQAFSNVVGPVVAASGSPWTLIGSASASGAASATTAAIDTTGADLLIVGVSFFTAAMPTLTDSKGNTWTILTLQINTATGYPRNVICYCVPTSVGSGHTVTLAGISLYGTLTFAAFSGAHATPFDQEAGGDASGVNTVSAGSGITPSVPNALVIANVGTSADTSVATAISGDFNMLTPIASVSGVNLGECLAYSMQTAAAAVDPTWTINIADNLTATIASFKPA